MNNRQFNCLTKIKNDLKNHQLFDIISSKRKNKIQQALNNTETSIIAKQWTQKKQWNLKYVHALLEELKFSIVQKQVIITS